MYIIEYQPPTAVNRWRHRRKIRKMGKDVTRYVAVPLVGLYLALAVLILLWTVDAIGEVVAVNEDSLLNIRAEPDVDASLRGALAPGAVVDVLEPAMAGRWCAGRAATTASPWDGYSENT